MLKCLVYDKDLVNVGNCRDIIKILYYGSFFNSFILFLKGFLRNNFLNIRDGLVW